MYKGNILAVHVISHCVFHKRYHYNTCVWAVLHAFFSPSTRPMEKSRFPISHPRTREDLDDATCAICQKIAVTPMHCRENHLFCESCIEQHLSTQTTCPVDSAALPSSALQPSPLAARLISRLIIRCTHAKPPLLGAVRRRTRHPPGCRWVGCVRDHGDHALHCAFRMSQCSFCLNYHPAVTLAAHLAACSARVMKCDLCDVQFASDAVDAHLQSCPAVAEPCPNACGIPLMPRQDIAAHLEQCVSQKVACEFRDLGCSFVASRADMRFHLHDQLVQHVALLRNRSNQYAHLLQRVERLEAASSLSSLSLVKQESVHIPTNASNPN